MDTWCLYIYISWLTHHPKREPDGDSTLHTNMQRSPNDILYQVHGKILARHEIVAGGHMHQHIEYTQESKTVSVIYHSHPWSRTLYTLREDQQYC